MAPQPLVRLCVEEVSRQIPLPPYAPLEASHPAGRHVRTPQPVTSALVPTQPAQVVPPWAISDEQLSSQAVDRRGFEKTVSMVDSAAVAAANMAAASQALRSKTPRRFTKPGRKPQESSLPRNDVSSQRPVQEARAARQMEGEGECADAQRVPTVPGQVVAATEAAAQAKAGLLAADKEASIKVAISAAQRDMPRPKAKTAGMGVPGMTPESLKDTVARLRLVRTANMEVKEALGAQVALQTSRKNYEKEQDKRYAAQLLAEDSRQEQDQVQAKASKKAREKEALRDIARQREDDRRRKATEHADQRSAVDSNGVKIHVGLMIGPDAFTELRKKQLLKSEAAALRAADLAEKNQKRKDQALQDQAQERAEEQVFLQREKAWHAKRDAEKEALLASQCAATFRGDIIGKDGQGLPKGRHAPRYRPTSAEWDAKAKQRQRDQAKDELQRMRQEAVEREQKLKAVTADAKDQIAQHQAAKRASAAESWTERAFVEAQAAADAQKEREDAAAERKKHIEHSKEVRAQADRQRVCREQLRRAW